jgi:hypothetical protein
MPDSVTIFECDHLRAVALDSELGVWKHIGPDGWLEGTCEAGVYKVKESTERHTLDKLVLDAKSTQ